jgi:DNA repair protein RecO (recombination protein O)
MRVESQPAYILHTRDYRDSSLLVEFITPDYGRVSGVVKGVRSSSKTARQRRSLMQPFVPLLIGWSGNSDLKTITRFENTTAPLALTGPRLFSAIYVNELLTRLLQHDDRNFEIYFLYEWVLVNLLQDERLDVVLRRFELRLLQALGYGIDLSTEVATGEQIVPDRDYCFVVDQGFCRLEQISQPIDKQQQFAGAELIAIRQEEFGETVRQAAKRLCRLALAVHLGDKPLKSRELFR